MQLVPAEQGTTCTLAIEGAACGAPAAVVDLEVRSGASEDDGFRCQQHLPLYKTTIVVWSHYPTGEDEEEMDLIGVAREATDGMMYTPLGNTWVRVDDPEADPDFDAGARAFFTDPRNQQ
jgi:hypothetical protein